MKTYMLNDGDTLVISINDGDWETVTFKAADFQDIQAATAKELADVINRSGDLAAYADEQGHLVLATASKGGQVSLEIDLVRSTAGAHLGLTSGQAQAQGTGLQAARLVSLTAEPFALPLGAEMMIVVDGRRRRITFDKDITPGKATAAEVVDVINALVKGIAHGSRDGRVMLTSPSIGADSSLVVEPGRVKQGKIDASSQLGLVGTAAFSQPYKATPATLVCSGRQIGLRVVNLRAEPIEFHFPTRTVVLPARDSLHLLSPSEVAYAPLQRLIVQGVVRLESATED